MSTDDTEMKDVYIRLRGRTSGPFDSAQLKLLHQRGQFSRAHEISEDGLNWRSASTLEQIFQASRRRVSAPARNAAATAATEPVIDFEMTLPQAPAVPPAKPTWYYSLDGEARGPVTPAEFRGLIVNGRLSEGDLVWRPGLERWLPAGEIEELQVVFASQTGNVSPTPMNGNAHSRRAAPGQHYCFACGNPADSRAEICPNCGVRQPGQLRSSKSRVAAALLAFFLGGLGVHHLYLGNLGLGILYLLFCWTLIPSLISFIEAIAFLCMSDESFARRYS